MQHIQARILKTCSIIEIPLRQSPHIVIFGVSHSSQPRSDLHVIFSQSVFLRSLSNILIYLNSCITLLSTTVILFDSPNTNNMIKFLHFRSQPKTVLNRYQSQKRKLEELAPEQQGSKEDKRWKNWQYTPARTEPNHRYIMSTLFSQLILE